VAGEKKPPARRHERHEGVLQVSFRDIATVGDYTENLSEGGLFIVTEQAFAPGEKIQFELSFPGLVKPIPVEAEVVWRRVRESLNDQQPPGIGVKLVLSTDVERAWLRQLIGRFASSASPSTAEGERARWGLVLLVEDNPLTRELFRDALQGQGGTDIAFDVAEVETTSDAWNVFQTQQVDLVLIEARLCREGELDLLTSIRERETAGAPRVPVVVLIGAEEERQGEGCKLADVILRRPVPAKALLQTIRSLGLQANDELA